MTHDELVYADNKATKVDFLIYNNITKQPVLVVEIDGYKYHKEGTDQAERDKLKNSILTKYKVPFIRLSTTGSQEDKKIESMLAVSQ